MTCALNVERVKKEERERKDKRQGKKNPGQSSSQQQQRKKFRGPQVLISLQLRLPVGILLYQYRQLQVHQEVLLEDRLLLIAPIVGEIIKQNVGDLQVLV